MPPFSINPWELPPDFPGPLVAPTELIFRNMWQVGTTHRNGIYVGYRKTEIWARRVTYKGRYFVFIRDGQRPDDVNWMLGGRKDRPFFWDDFSQFERWFWNNSPWYDSIYRYVYFDGESYGFPGSHRIAIHPHSDIYGIRSDTVQSHSNFKSLMRSDSEDYPTSALFLKNELVSALDDENSEARFALDWLHLTTEQRQQKVLFFENGNAPEMKTILRAALMSQDGLWEEDKPVKWHTYDWKQEALEGYSRRDELGFVDQSITSRSLAKWRPRLNRWKQVIWNHYRPSFNETLLDFARCVVCRDTYWFFMIEASPPTTHERLEAELLLRHWWQQNFPGQSFETQNAA